MTEQSTQTKPRATRKSEAVVMVQFKVDQSIREGRAWAGDDEFPTITAAQKWIAAYGKDGETYRVIRAWPAVKVIEEPNPTRTVVPA